MCCHPQVARGQYTNMLYQTELHELGSRFLIKDTDTKSGCSVMDSFLRLNVKNETVCPYSKSKQELGHLRYFDYFHFYKMVHLTLMNK